MNSFVPSSPSAEESGEEGEGNERARKRYESGIHAFKAAIHLQRGDGDDALAEMKEAHRIRKESAPDEIVQHRDGLIVVAAKVGDLALAEETSDGDD